MTALTRSAAALGAAAAVAFLAGCRPHPAAGRAGTAIRTTDGAIAMGNLDVQIATQERRVAAEPASVPVLASLVDLLLTRAQVVGSPDDLDRAESYAARAATMPREGGHVSLLAAAVGAALHRFPQALRDLAEAERSGADRDLVEARRASVLHAMGELDAALAIRRELAATRPGITTLGQLAITEAARGELGAAREHLAQALRTYRDTSPFPVAWIEFQGGRVAESAGDLDEAARQYRSAVARLPQYAEAAGHLAAVEQVRGHSGSAEELLRPLAGVGRDPQYAVQLAGVVATGGGYEEAARLREDAGARYDALLSRHPEAYADHAARSLIRTDAPRALALARVNLAVRHTWEAYDLALWAAERAGAHEEGCRIAADALARRSPPERISFAATRTLERCRGSVSVASGGTGRP